MMSARASVGLGPVLRRAAFYPAVSKSPVLRAQAALLSKRLIQTESFPATASEGILNKQRLNRPSSPHFTIYQPQLTWVASIANRFTGAALSGLLYAFSLAYLVAPGTFDSAHVIDFVATFPEWLKYADKVILAAPFAFHSLNGLRHLTWDLGKFITVKGAYSTGYAVLGATAVSTIALVLM